MKNNKGFTLIELIVVIVIFFCLIGEAFNIYRLATSDWKAPWKREAIYSIALFICLPIGFIDIKEK